MNLQTTNEEAAGPAVVSEAILRQRLAALSPEQKARILTRVDWWALHPEPAAGLRRLAVSDGPVGAWSCPG
jgi:beta-glucosidase